MAVMLGSRTTEKLVESNQYIVIFTFIVHMVVVYNGVAVGIGGMAIANIAISIHADTCFHSHIRITRSGKFTIMIVFFCPLYPFPIKCFISRNVLQFVWKSTVCYTTTT